MSEQLTRWSFGSRKLVKDASHKRRGNIDVSDRVPQVVRTRDARKGKLIQKPVVRDTYPEPPPLVDTISATARQLALAGGSKTPIFKDGMGGVDQSSYGSVAMGVRLASGNTIYFGGPTVILDQTPEAVRALFLTGTQTLAEARTRLATAITDRDTAQQAVDSKLAAWDRAVQHSDAAYASVLTLRKRLADAKAESVDTLLVTGVISPPRSVAVSLELQAAEQAFEVSTKARATVLADLQERKLILQRSEEIVLGHAFEVLQSESSLLAVTAREAVQTAQAALESLHALENVSHRYTKDSTRPQVLSPTAIEAMSAYMPNAQGDAAQSDAWAEYIARLTKSADAIKENQP